MKIEILCSTGSTTWTRSAPSRCSRAPGLDTTFVTAEPVECVTSTGGARIVPHGVLGDPDLVLVPGGGWSDKGGPGACAEARAASSRRCCASATRPAAGSARSAPARCCWPRRACSTGRRATTHHTAHEDLETYGVDVVEDARFVDDGDIITAAGVTSGIDMALHLVEQALGADAARPPPPSSNGTEVAKVAPLS